MPIYKRDQINILEVSCNCFKVLGDISHDGDDTDHRENTYNKSKKIILTLL